MVFGSFNHICTHLPKFTPITRPKTYCYGLVLKKDLTHYVYVIRLIVGINLNGGQIMHIQILGLTYTIKICSCTLVC